jgi:hypothetical protein
MFNVNNFLSRPQKFILEQNFKSYLNDSVNKYNKLTIQINEDAKTKKAMKSILNETSLTRDTNHIQYNLINNANFSNFYCIVSFVSIGALIFYKNFNIL